MSSIIERLFSPPSVNRDQALSGMERVSALTHIVASAEYLVRRRIDDEPGALTAGRNQEPIIAQMNLPRPVRAVVQFASRPRVATALHTGRVLAGLGLVVRTPSPFRAVCDAYLAISTAVLYPRNRWGSDGSDQVTLQTQTAAAVARLSNDTVVTDIALSYISLQGVMSYAISGWVKLFGQSWRDASALPGVMRTRTYGCRPVYQWAIRHPVAAKRVTHSMLVAEAAFPLVFVTRGHLTKPMIAWALAFHISNAGFMGLGRFVTAFASMHPPIAYVTSPHHAGTRSRALPLVTAALTVALLGTATARTALRRRRVLTAPTGCVTVASPTGNHISATRTPGPRERPVCFIEAGMMTTSSHYQLLADELARDFEVITYSRAGYGASRRSSAAPFDFVESGIDATAVVDALIDRDRSIVFIGHSLGGYLSTQHARRHGARTMAVVYLDSTHPEQLQRSALQKEGAEGFSTSFRLSTPSIRSGWGSLLSTPRWADEFPPELRSRSITEYRDARLWVAAEREWSAALDVFRMWEQPLPHVPGSALVISASDTIERDPEQYALHNELGEAHGQAAHLVVNGATHDSLISHRPHVAEIAAAVRAHLLENEAAA
jgi:pimeloyl-ACP methyl ester carboxylesterase